MILFFLFVYTWPLSRPLEVRLLGVGFRSQNAPGPLSFMQPALELAVEDLNQSYNGSLTFVADVVSDSRWPTCQELQPDYDQIAAGWYYNQVTEPNRVLVLTPIG